MNAVVLFSNCTQLEFYFAFQFTCILNFYISVVCAYHVYDI